MTSGPTAFEFMKGAQRRHRQAATTAAGFGADGMDGDLFGPVEQQLHFPLSEGSVACDEHRGLWWAVQGQRVHYFPLVGAQWPPAAVHMLPEDAALSSARCLALLSGASSGSSGHGGHVRTSRSTEPSAVAVLTDLRLVVFGQGNGVIIPRPAHAPLGQVPLFVLAAASHYSGPGQVGVVLVVGTMFGRLFSLILQQCSSGYQAEAGPLWPTSSNEGHGLGHRFLKRVRRSFGVEQQDDVEDSGLSAAEVLPPLNGASADTLFAVLVWGAGTLSLYLQAQSAKGATLIWKVSVADLMGGLPGTLLAARTSEEGAVMLLYQGRSSQETVLARLPWTTSWQHPPQPGSASAAVGHAYDSTGRSSGQSAFLCTSGRTTVAAVRLDDHRCLLSTAYFTTHGLEVIERKTLEMGILGLCFAADASASSTAGTVIVVTPRGLVPQGRPAELEQSRPDGLPVHAEVPFPSDASAALQTAFDCYAVGHEDWATGVGPRWRDFLQSRAPEQLRDLLKALEAKRREMLDTEPDVSNTSRWRGVKENVVTRYLLFDKAREIEVWLAFLADTGVWTVLGGVPGELDARQGLAEACERVFVASRMRELDDNYPDVFMRAIHDGLSHEALGKSADGKAHSFYAKVSRCERLLVGLKNGYFPRSHQQGSSEAADAVILSNAIAATFLEAALERREHVVSMHATLLPPPEPRHLSPYLQGSAPPPRALGSSWLVSGDILDALEVLRRHSLEVIPGEQVRGLALLDAQALRVVQSLRALCRATLRAAHATYANLHCTEMARLRRGVLEHLTLAEAALAASAGPHAGLLLAEEFEDFDFIVDLCVDLEPQRLEKHIEESERFRAAALAKFLRAERLRPLFFRTIERFPMPLVQIKELLAEEGCPELYWVIEVHKLDAQAAEAAWRPVLREVEHCAIQGVQAEKHSAARREMFAALAKLAQAAQNEESSVHPGSAIVDDLACVARLHRVCRRFDGEGEDAAAAPMAVEGWATDEQPPATAESCLQGLERCFQNALAALREEGADGTFLADVVQLVLLVERRLVQAGADLTALLELSAETAAGKDVETVRALQRIWGEAVKADINAWCSLVAGYIDGHQRDLCRSNTVFYRMLAGAGDWPQSASVEELCDHLQELQELRPELQLVAVAARTARAEA